MKNNRTRLHALAAAFALSALLALAAAFAGAKPQGKYRPGPPPTNANVAVERGGNENRGSEVVKNKNGNENVGIPDSACRRRCRADYRRCLRGGKSRRSCEWRLRNCYRHCPQ